MRTPIDGNNPGFVNHFLLDDDGILHLNDSACIVVIRWKGASRDASSDASLPRTTVFIRIGEVCEIVIPSGFGFRAHWYAAIRRIDHDRGTNRTETTVCPVL